MTMLGRTFENDQRGRFPHGEERRAWNRYHDLIIGIVVGALVARLTNLAIFPARPISGYSVLLNVIVAAALFVLVMALSRLVELAALRFAIKSRIRRSRETSDKIRDALERRGRPGLKAAHDIVRPPLPEPPVPTAASRHDAAVGVGVDKDMMIARAIRRDR
jgi:hypothetical protein